MSDSKKKKKQVIINYYLTVCHSEDDLLTFHWVSMFQ